MTLTAFRLHTDGSNIDRQVSSPICEH